MPFASSGCKILGLKVGDMPVPPLNVSFDGIPVLDPTHMRKSSHFLRHCPVWLLFGLLAWVAPLPAFAQNLTPASEPFFRYSILTEMVALRFNSPHPFKQMTDFSVFNTPVTLPQTGLNFETRLKGQKDNGLLEPLLRRMPPFSVEYVIPLDFFFIRGASFMYYHVSVNQFDEELTSNSTTALSRIPLIRMITYFDFATASVHFFNPAAEGVDIFVGASMVNVAGVYEGGFRPRLENNFVETTRIKNFSVFPVFMRRIGIDTNGEFFGLRFTMYLFNRENLIKDNVFFGNPLTPNAKKNIDFEGLLLRTALTFRF